MNVVIISPNFPACNVHFCTRLQAAGVNVLGIGDGSYDHFDAELRYGLTEYYHVDDIGDYESVYRACAYYVYRYGRIDRIESFNAYWLETEAKLRKEYQVPGRQKPVVKSTSLSPVCTITALLGGDKTPTALVQIMEEGENAAVTQKELEPAVQKLWEETAQAVGMANEFFTASFSRKKDGEYQLAACYPAPAPLSLDLMNYTCDCDVFALWAQAAVGNPSSQAFAPLYACMTVRTDYTQDYPALAELPEEYLVQEAPTDQIYANTKNGSVLVYRFPDQAEANGALRGIVAPAQQDKPLDQPPAKPKRSPAKRTKTPAAAEKKAPLPAERKGASGAKAAKKEPVDKPGRKPKQQDGQK